MKKKRLLLIIFQLSALSSQLSAIANADSLNRAEALYLQGSYSESIEECAVNIARNRAQDQAYYLLGLNYLKINDTERAREKLKYLMDNFKSSQYLEPARLAYSDTYFVEQDYPKAKGMYEDILKAGGELTAAVYLRLHQSALKSGDWQVAREYANILKQRYPLSLEAAAAEEMPRNNDLFFTVQIGSFANFQNATRLLNKIKGQNFDGYIDELHQSGNSLYRVRVGKLSSRQEVEALKKNLEERGYPTRIFP